MMKPQRYTDSVDSARWRSQAAASHAPAFGAFIAAAAARSTDDDSDESEDDSNESDTSSDASYDSQSDDSDDSDDSDASSDDSDASSDDDDELVNVRRYSHAVSNANRNASLPTPRQEAGSNITSTSSKRPPPAATASSKSWYCVSCDEAFASTGAFKLHWKMHVTCSYAHCRVSTTRDAMDRHVAIAHSTTTTENARPSRRALDLATLWMSALVAPAPATVQFPPRGYVCKRCGVPGHFYNDCTASASKPSAMSAPSKATSKAKSTARSTWRCNSCHLTLQSELNWTSHCNDHVACPSPDCSFAAITRIVREHVKTQHADDAAVCAMPLVPPVNSFCTKCRQSGHWASGCPRTTKQAATTAVKTLPSAIGAVRTDMGASAKTIDKATDPSKPWRCEVCDKDFALQSYQLQHVRDHVACAYPTCNFRASSSVVTLHTATAHPLRSSGATVETPGNDVRACTTADVKRSVATPSTSDHSTTTLWRCGPCNKAFALELELTTHCGDHVACPSPDCSFAAITRLVREHVKTQHADDAAVGALPLAPPVNYRCDVCKQPGHWAIGCPQRKASVAQMSTSVATNSSSSSSSDNQPAFARTTLSVGTWLKNAGPPPATYVCKACGERGHYIYDCAKRLPRAQVAKTNAPMLTTAKQQLKCESCLMVFSHGSQLASHYGDHVACPSPDCSFSAITRLVREHIELQHAAEPAVRALPLTPPVNYRCDVCSQSGHWSSDCPRITTPSATTAVKTLPSANKAGRTDADPSGRTTGTGVDAGKDPTKPWRCDVCDKGFALQSYQLQHVRDHVACSHADCGFRASASVVQQHAATAHRGPTRVSATAVADTDEEVVVVLGERYVSRPVTVDGKAYMVLMKVADAAIVDKIKRTNDWTFDYCDDEDSDSFDDDRYSL